MGRPCDQDRQHWWRSEWCQEALVTLVFLSGVVVMALLSWALTFWVFDQISGPESAEARILGVNSEDHLADEVLGSAPCTVICRDMTGGGLQ